MSEVGYVAAVLLGLAFARAALAKVLEPEATRASFAALGVPAAAGAARLVPVVEAALALALLVVPGLAGAVALALLAFFSTFLAGRLRAGVRAPCGCFGAASAHDLSLVDLVRNAALGVLAVGALVAGRPVVPRPGHVLLVVAATLLVAVGLARGRRAVAR